jgi:phosphoribosylformylglycinamidine synthase II
MITRINVYPLKIDKKRDHYAISSYLLSHELSSDEIEKIAESLTNKILENFSLDTLTAPKGYNFGIEISYKPGVTDNVSHTVKENVFDLIGKNSGVEVFSSTIYLSKQSNLKNAEIFTNTVHNSLIERATIVKIKNNELRLPNNLPKVILQNKASVIRVNLEVPDAELKKIGIEGIMDPGGKRRGPLALDLESMNAIKKYFTKLGRNPTDIELESLAQTWSEHCKHTIFANPIDDIKDGLYKTYIKGATNLIRKRKGSQDFCVSVFSDNAGGIVFDDEYLITHKVETHNTPSTLDPYGGAITGIVGVNRDCLGFGLGAKPVANTYGFCLGEPDDKRPLYRNKELTEKIFSPKRIMEGVVKGINSGGNCSGIPTANGFVRFDDRFRGKPLVFAGTVGLIPRKINDRESHIKKAEVGDYIVVVGGRVGADGIHGATFSSVVMDSKSPSTAVQIGDPITQKKFSDAIVKEARAMNLYNSITDNGAGGISCSIAEMARECGGAKVELDKVPLKYPGLRPWEIWISESQERMTLAVPKKKWNLLHTLLSRRGVEATVIGEFTNSGKCAVTWEGKTIMDVELEFLHNGLPKRDLQTEKVIINYPEPILPKGTSRTPEFEKLVSINNVASFEFISEQYDHEVQASSVIKPLSGAGKINTDAQVVAPLLGKSSGAVITSALYPSYSLINTYDMALASLDTAVRNAVAAGAKLSHLAILDNFCWCSSNDKTRLWELVQAVRACYDGAIAYETPFISGKDSMFNDFSGYNEKGESIKISVPPTLLISAIGVIPDIYKTVTPEFKNVGDIIYLLGDTNDELGGSEYAKMLGTLGNKIPKVNLKKNLATYQVLEEAINQDLLASSTSVHSGGLALALAKSSVGGMLGVKINLEGALGVDAKLFSESQGRILVSVNPRNSKKFEKLVSNISCHKLGLVTKDSRVVINNGTSKLVESNTKRLHQIYHKFSDNLR